MVFSTTIPTLPTAEQHRLDQHDRVLASAAGWTVVLGPACVLATLALQQPGAPALAFDPWAIAASLLSSSEGLALLAATTLANLALVRYLRVRVPNASRRVMASVYLALGELCAAGPLYLLWRSVGLLP